MTEPSLFEKICEPHNIVEAYRRTRKGVSKKRDADEFVERLEHRILKLSDDLRAHRYNFGPYQVFRVRDPKERNIYVAPFPDRVAHHAINWYIEPILSKSFIKDSYACQKGKGNLAALQRLQRWLNGDPETYVLKMDIKRYFASVDRAILLAKVAKKIKDPDVFKTLEKLVYTAPSDPGYEGIGLPIGNLTSQTFANVYLDTLDHFAKDKLGIKRYMRYVDDFLCLGPKRAMHETRKVLKEFLGKWLKLTVDPEKDLVLHARNGVPFLGFVLRPNQRPRLRREAVKRFLWKQKQAKEMGLSQPDIAAKVLSWYGYAKLADVRQLLERSDTMKYVECVFEQNI